MNSILNFPLHAENASNCCCSDVALPAIIPRLQPRAALPERHNPYFNIFFVRVFRVRVRVRARVGVRVRASGRVRVRVRFKGNVYFNTVLRSTAPNTGGSVQRVESNTESPIVGVRIK